jgi:CheY-like chemotaxis protein
MATMLIVTDDRLTAEALRRHLTRHGHTVLPPAPSAEAALAAVQAHHPEVVFMDSRLRDDGAGLVAGQMIEVTAGIPVIYLSEYPRAQSPAPLDGPALLFSVTNPLDKDALVRTLAWALQYGAHWRTLRALADRAAEGHQQATALWAEAKDLRQQAQALRDSIHRRPPDAGTGEITEEPDLYAKDARLTVRAVEPPALVVEGLDGVHYRARCVPLALDESRRAAPLQPGDMVIVTSMTSGLAVIERVTAGQRDGCWYVLLAFQRLAPHA